VRPSCQGEELERIAISYGNELSFWVNARPLASNTCQMRATESVHIGTIVST
jgi:hypothetical protein